MSKKAGTTPKKSTPKRRSPVKRRHQADAEMEVTGFEENAGNLSKRSRKSLDLDFDDSATDWSEDLMELFSDKFEEKSPTSKLSGSFKHVGLKESNLLKAPKRSSFGGRKIGITSAERQLKYGSRRSLELPKSSDQTSPPPTTSRHRKLDLSPKKK